MHSSKREGSRIIAIHHNGDWSGLVHVCYYKDPSKRSGEWTEWQLYGEDLLSGLLGRDPLDGDGDPVPLKVVSEAISIAAHANLRHKAMYLIEQL